MEEIETTKGNAEETLQKIINFTEGRKALTYENQNNLHFILAPIKTRTFKNEVTALHIAQAIKKILTEHNRIFKQKVDFGISMNNGVIIAKPALPVKPLTQAKRSSHAATYSPPNISSRGT